MRLLRSVTFLNRFVLRKIRVPVWTVPDLSNLQIESISLEGTKMILRNEVKGRVLGGEVIVVRRCLQAMELKEEIDQLVLDKVEQIGGVAASRRLRSLGFHRLHEVLRVEDLENFYFAMESEIPEYGLNTLSRLVFGVLQRREELFVETSPNTRINFPFERTKNFQGSLKNSATRAGRGKFTLHGPHQDSWYHHPWNTINVWAAVGPVSEKNGLAFFPRAWKQNPAFDEDGVMKSSNDNGPSFGTKLEEGDALIFCADQVHSSVLNQTDKTRLIISMRMCLDRPQFPNLSVYDYRRIRFQSGETMRPMVQRVASLRFLKSRLKGVDSIVRPSPPEKSEVSTKKVDSVREGDGGKISFVSKELLDNEISRLTDKICVARIEGEVKAFNRYCPHEAADLSTGSIQEGEIVCPWHHLKIDSTTGESTCKGLGNLKMYPSNTSGDHVEVEVQK